MKIRHALGLAALLALPVAQAADAPAKPMMKQEHAMPCDMMDDCPAADEKNELKLTDEQKKKLQAIHQEARAKHDAIRTETQTKIKSVLTPEQYKKHEEMRAKRMERREDRMERHLDRHEGRVDRRKEHMEQRKEKMTTE